MTTKITGALWLAMSAGLSFADLSSNAPLVQIATNTPLDFRFIDHYVAPSNHYVAPSNHYVAPSKLSRGGSIHFPDQPRFLTTTYGAYHYGCRFFGLEATVYFYSDRVLARIRIPGRYRAELTSELTRRYGTPSKTTDSASSWDIQADGERRHITLHKNALLERKINGKKQPLPDEALLDVTRMKAEEDRQPWAEPDDVEVIIEPQQSAAPLSHDPPPGHSDGAR